jgi:hypothetical protein
MGSEKGRQSRADAKKRKAKARAKHAADYGSWQRRLKTMREAKAPRRALIAPPIGSLHLDAMEHLIANWEHGGFNAK